MDVADRALQDMEVLEQYTQKRRPVLKAEATGECLWCGEPVKGGRRWCDATCRNAWEKLHRKLQAH